MGVNLDQLKDPTKGKIFDKTIMFINTKHSENTNLFINSYISNFIITLIIEK